MKYLSFDIECCDGVHICEFGYVLVDNNFTVLERDCLTINPEHEFKLRGREHESDITLAFSEEVYFSSPKFDFYYDRIRRLLSLSDCTIIGFSMKNDQNFLLTACKNYEKEPIEFSGFDVQKMYKIYSGSKNKQSLETLVEGLHIEGIRLHRSDNDAFATIRVMQEIAKKDNMTFTEVVSLMKQKKYDFFKEQDSKTKEKAINGNLKMQRKIIKKTLQSLDRNSHNTKNNDFFSGKRVCVSFNYQKNKFESFIELIKQLCRVGATYTGKSSDCDIFIDCENNDKNERRYVVVRDLIDEGKDVKIISLDKALALLSITEQDLKNSSYSSRKTVKPKPTPNLLGDIIKASGIKIECVDDD